MGGIRQRKNESQEDFLERKRGQTKNARMAMLDEKFDAKLEKQKAILTKENSLASTEDPAKGNALKRPSNIAPPPDNYESGEDTGEQSDDELDDRAIDTLAKAMKRAKRIVPSDDDKEEDKEDKEDDEDDEDEEEPKKTLKKKVPKKVPKKTPKKVPPKKKEKKAPKPSPETSPEVSDDEPEIVKKVRSARAPKKQAIVKRDLKDMLINW